MTYFKENPSDSHGSLFQSNYTLDCNSNLNNAHYVTYLPFQSSGSTIAVTKIFVFRDSILD